MDNGGLRPEYNKYNKSNHVIFASSLRNDCLSPVRYFKDPYADRADITSYLNWMSQRGKQQSQLNAKITTALTNRLTSKDPSPPRIKDLRLYKEEPHTAAAAIGSADREING